ncbi:branched-chain amino acid ABC transporter permease [Fredinandcohnia onubensis]|uniref:branched-chain amino acid ABC transporter permease n=1 Tax=Fredinandcohnia onubensis TaxID=1571209 RepID=UPI00211DDD6F|nr:branched-chain amino acid ABC transporter permease [Fredinandcohnia onubensis]
MDFINPYYVDILIFLGIYILLGLGLNLTTGYAGQVSLGHAAFYGIGAYTSAILSANYSVNVWLSILIAVVVTFILGALLGLPSLRLSDDFLAITTLGLGLVAHSFFNNSQLTGGAYGVNSIPAPTLFGIEVENIGYLILVVIAVVVVIYIMRKITRSRIGRAWVTIREDETVAQSMGINTMYYKVLAFAIGAAFAGVAGALFAHKIYFINADSFTFTTSATILSMIVIGGLGSIRGTLLGVTLLYTIPELFHIFDVGNLLNLNYLDNYKMILYGLLMVLVMRYSPKGLIDIKNIKARNPKPAVKSGDQNVGS